MKNTYVKCESCKLFIQLEKDNITTISKKIRGVLYTKQVCDTCYYKEVTTWLITNKREPYAQR